MRMFLILALLASIAANREASAQTVPPPPPAPTGSAYCSCGAGAFTLSAEQGYAETRQKCKPGDTILLPGDTTGAIARICDFSRSIVSTAGLLLCVVTAQRAKR